MTSWNIQRKNIFKKQYKSIGHGRQLDVYNIISDLVISKNPTNLGKYKQNKKVHAYEIGKSDRLIFTLDYANRIILFQSM